MVEPLMDIEAEYPHVETEGSMAGYRYKKLDCCPGGDCVAYRIPGPE